MAGESKPMMQCLDLTKQPWDRMDDSLQFTFKNQDSVGDHKMKSHIQQVRDNLREQEFKENVEVDTFDNKNKDLEKQILNPISHGV